MENTQREELKKTSRLQSITFHRQLQQPQTTMQDPKSGASTLPPLQTRIEVFWADDGVWFGGTVSAHLSNSVVTLIYDDGMCLDEDLSKQKWRKLRPCGPAVLATALMCTIAQSRLMLPESAFIDAPVSFGVVVPALLRSRCDQWFESEDLDGGESDEVQNAFYEAITGPLRAAAAAAAGGSSEARRDSCLRIAVRAGEMYELRFSQHEHGHRSRRDTEIRNGATCALRALQCYLLTMPPPQREGTTIQFSLHVARPERPGRSSNQSSVMRQVYSSKDNRACQVHGTQKTPLATVEMEQCRIECLLYSDLPA